MIRDLDGGLGRDRVARRDPRRRDRLVQLRGLLRRRGHQGVHEDDRPGGGQGPPGLRPRPAASHGAVREVTIAAVNSLALGGGCELSMALRLPDRRGIGQLRPARDQPRDHPRLRRHPAAARLVGEGKALEMNLLGDADLGGARPMRSGSPTRSSPTTSCSTRRSPGRASWVARRRWRSSRSRRSRRTATWTRASRPRRSGFATAFGSEDAREGISAFLGQAQAASGRASSASAAEELAGADRGERARRRSR